MPGEYSQLISGIKSNTQGIENVIILTRCQNDLGLSTINTIAVCHVEQPDFATVEVEEKKVSDQAGEENELMLDGGFVVPPTNAFGHTFRALLDYDVNSDRSDGVEEFYRINYINQSVDFVSKQRQIRFSSIWRSLFERDKVKGEGEKHQIIVLNKEEALVAAKTLFVINVDE
ncbi:unnamed protein product [Prunus armeniaca]|uniref:inositol oxygenase n=1 Tax=Prunus armeniaca TaxID=36596 RepID=A0A6J5WIH9_PRUAR|nr:unnamed protein product [Prunus armeniaca]